jgi:hypothetical protein
LKCNRIVFDFLREIDVFLNGGIDTSGKIEQDQGEGDFRKRR